MPVMEHPLDQSWGYQVSNYFAPTSRFGTPDDFMYFVDYCHLNGIGVILDWVPAHFPSDEHGLANFDSSQLYAYKSLKKGYHMDWGTFVFDYGRNEVRNFLISNAIYWLDKYHIDGLRVDAVASMLYLDYSRNEGEWEPNIYGGRENLEAIEFLKQLNIRVHEYFKGIVMIAEESTAFPGVTLPVYLGGLGFDMKWNMGWMNDILAYFSKDPVHRKYHHNLITFSLWYAFSENFILPVSHDEVVHGKKSLYDKMPGDTWQKFANLRLFLAFMFGHPGKKLNFMGNDIAQYNEWNCDNMTDWFLLDYDYHSKVNLFMKDLNEMYKNSRALYEIDFKIEGFQWIDLSDSENSVISFMRKSLDGRQILVFTFNFTPVVRENYLFGVPYEGFYREILNSDALEYGGSGTGNSGGVHSTKEKRFEWDNSIRVNLPPLGANVFFYEIEP
jgi:1,4-alpha-glucan branching enzyme